MLKYTNILKDVVWILGLTYGEQWTKSSALKAGCRSLRIGESWWSELTVVQASLRLAISTAQSWPSLMPCSTSLTCVHGSSHTAQIRPPALTMTTPNSKFLSTKTSCADDSWWKVWKKMAENDCHEGGWNEAESVEDKVSKCNFRFFTYYIV